MAIRELPPTDLLRKLLHYDPLAGLLTWRQRTPDMFVDSTHSRERRCKAWNVKNAGRKAGTPLRDTGYIIIKIAKEGYLAHRLAWKIAFPNYPLDPPLTPAVL